VQQKKLKQLLRSDAGSKVDEVLEIFKACKVDEWAEALKEQYFEKAIKHLDAAAVLSKRKEPLRELAQFLMQRDY
jgi:geranylgeranyl diphosphate synthase type II